MTAKMAIARDAKPPLVLVRMMNPAMRLLLRTPLGRAIRPLALLEFRGRRTGRRYLVPVGWHSLNNGPAVFTPAPWRTNFARGHPATVHHLGRHRTLVGTLDTDPQRVAAAMQELIDRHGSLRPVGVDVPVGHRVTEVDVRTVDRALITFTVAPAPTPNSNR